MGAMQRRKGMRGENDLATMLTERLGATVKRRLSQSRDGGHDLEMDGWALEVKRASDPQIKKWWLQTLDQSSDLKPALAYRLDRHDWRFIVRLSDILRSMVVGQDWVTAELCIDGFCMVVRESIDS
jgi:Holliday junction resolvase